MTLALTALRTVGQLDDTITLPIPLLALDSESTDLSNADTEDVCTVVSANWLDAIRYPIQVTLLKS